MSDLDDVQKMVQDLMQEASTALQTEIEENDESTSTNELNARLSKKALELTVERSMTIRSIQMHVVATIARHELWRWHPPTEDYPDGYSNIFDMLTDAGIPSTLRWVLNSIGENLVPFCDQNGIGIDQYMVNSLRPKLEAAMAALNAAVKDGNPGQVTEILSDIAQMPGRDSVRAKYAKDHGDMWGTGTTVRLPNDKVVLVALMDEAYVESAVRAVGGKLEWTLAAVAHQAGGSRFTVDVEDV